ncbi:MAG: hypothetical protein Q4A07_03585 [Coriobacteriales bacterium]|nr:hypothetical protein [Coriobacteriales bacterium]
MKEFKIYVGLNDKNSLTQTFEDEKYISILKMVCRNYHLPFSFTLSSGGYFMDTGEYTEEHTLVISLVDVDQSVVDEVAENLCVFFNQESVLITESEIRSHFVRGSIPKL